MNDSKDYYKLLNISRDASYNEIKRAYREKAHQLHPDKNKDIDTEEEFKQINEAYVVLINELKRKEYDSSFTSFDRLVIKFNRDEEITNNELIRFKTDIISLTCECTDWITNRKSYGTLDPRRLCRHLVSGFIDETEDNFENTNSHSLSTRIQIYLPEELRPFHDDIMEMKYKNRGVKLFDEIIFFKDSIVVIKKPKPQSNAKTFISLYLRKQPNHIFSYKVFNAYFYKGIGYKWIHEDDTPVLIKDNLEGKDYINKRFNVVNHNIQLCNKIYRAFIENKNEVNLELQNELYKYYKTEDMLIINKTTHTTSTFNKILEKIGFIEKSKDFNYNKWILKNEALEYGINFCLKNKVFNSRNNKRYKIAYFDRRTLSLKEIENDMFLTTIMWNRERFPELLKKIGENNEPSIYLERINFSSNVLESFESIDSNEKYLKTKNILQLCKAPFGVATFNKILKELKIIEKIEYKRGKFTRWILINEGLIYGDNILDNYNGQYNYITSIELENTKKFKWVEKKIESNLYNDYKHIAHDDFLSINEKEYFPHTDIYWKTENFLELYKQIRDIFDNNLKKKYNGENRMVVKNSNPSCPYCECSSTHKKGIRERVTYKMQRYQCSECKKIFQEKII